MCLRYYIYEEGALKRTWTAFAGFETLRAFRSLLITLQTVRHSQVLGCLYGMCLPLFGALGRFDILCYDLRDGPYLNRMAVEMQSQW